MKNNGYSASKRFIARNGYAVSATDPRKVVPHGQMLYGSVVPESNRIFFPRKATDELFLSVVGVEKVED